MDIKLDVKTLLAAANFILFIVVLPLLKYIWSNHVKRIEAWQDRHEEEAAKYREERKKEFDEFMHEVSNSIKEERKFNYEIFTKHDDNLAQLYDRTKNLCTSHTEIEGDIKMIKKVCDERHGKS